MTKKIIRIILTSIILLSIILSTLTSCEINEYVLYRRLSVINLETDTILMTIEGYFSIAYSPTTYTDREIIITIKTGEDQYKTKNLYFDDSNIIYLLENVEKTDSKPYYYEIKNYAIPANNG